MLVNGCTHACARLHVCVSGCMWVVSVAVARVSTGGFVLACACRFSFPCFRESACWLCKRRSFLTGFMFLLKCLTCRVLCFCTLSISSSFAKTNSSVSDCPNRKLCLWHADLRQEVFRKKRCVFLLFCTAIAGALSEAMEVDQKILFNIALGVSTTLECEGLAAYLGVDERLVKSLKDRNKEPREIAHEVLKTWAKKEDATPRKLYHALHDCKLDSLQALIEAFRDQLCKDSGKLPFYFSKVGHEKLGSNWQQFACNINGTLF